MKRAIRVFDAFPILRADGRVFYFLVLEYAEHGDLSAFLERGGKGWSETVVRRMLNPRHDTKPEKIQAALEMLGKRITVAVEDAA